MAKLYCLYMYARMKSMYLLNTLEGEKNKC